MTAAVKVALFRRLFRGRDDVYPKLVGRRARGGRLAFCHWLPAGLCLGDPARVDASRIRIAAEPGTPYILVKKLLFTANMVGYTRVSLLARDDRGRVRRLALPWAPCEEWERPNGGCVASCTRWGEP